MAEQVKAEGRAEQMLERALRVAEIVSRKTLGNLRPDEIAKDILAFAEAERERALEEAAKAVCHACGLGRKPVFIDGKFGHTSIHMNETFPCQASAIHELRREKGRG